MSDRHTRTFATACSLLRCFSGFFPSSFTHEGDFVTAPGDRSRRKALNNSTLLWTRVFGSYVGCVCYLNGCFEYVPYWQIYSEGCIAIQRIHRKKCFPMGRYFLAICNANFVGIRLQ